MDVIVYCTGQITHTVNNRTQLFQSYCTSRPDDGQTDHTDEAMRPSLYGVVLLHTAERAKPDTSHKTPLGSSFIETLMGPETRDSAELSLY